MAVELCFAPISTGAHAGRRGIEARLDGQRVGELTATMSQRYAPLVDDILRAGGRAGCVALVSRGKRGIEVELRLPVVADGVPAAFPAGPFPPVTTPAPHARPNPSRPAPPVGRRPGPERGGPADPPARRRRSRAPYWIGAGVATLLVVIGANIGGGTATVTATAGATAPTATAAPATTQSPPTTTAPAVVPAAVPGVAPDAAAAVVRGTGPAAAPRATTPRATTPRATTPRATTQSRPAPAQTAAQAPAPQPAPAGAPAPAPKPAPQAAPKASGGCDPNYSGCVPIARDVDCAGGSGNGPAYVQGPVKVTGTDIYGLDGDKDGTGCDG